MGIEWKTDFLLFHYQKVGKRLDPSSVSKISIVSAKKPVNSRDLCVRLAQINHALTALVSKANYGDFLTTLPDRVGSGD